MSHRKSNVGKQQTSQHTAFIAAARAECQLYKGKHQVWYSTVITNNTGTATHVNCSKLAPCLSTNATAHSTAADSCSHWGPPTRVHKSAPDGWMQHNWHVL
jgi:hypothetical protein